MPECVVIEVWTHQEPWDAEEAPYSDQEGMDEGFTQEVTYELDFDLKTHPHGREK